MLAELLDEHEELMFSLLGKIEEKRNAIQVRALDLDLEEIEPDEVIKELLATFYMPSALHPTPPTSHLPPHTSHLTPQVSHFALQFEPRFANR